MLHQVVTVEQSPHTHNPTSYFLTNFCYVCHLLYLYLPILILSLYLLDFFPFMPNFKYFHTSIVWIMFLQFIILFTNSWSIFSHFLSKNYILCHICFFGSSAVYIFICFLLIMKAHFWKMRWFQCKNYHLQRHDLQSVLASPKGADRQDYLELSEKIVEAPEQQVAFASIQGIFQTSLIDENVSSY